MRAIKRHIHNTILNTTDADALNKLLTLYESLPTIAFKPEPVTTTPIVVTKPTVPVAPNRTTKQRRIIVANNLRTLITNTPRFSIRDTHSVQSLADTHNVSRALITTIVINDLANTHTLLRGSQIPSQYHYILSNLNNRMMYVVTNELADLITKDK